MILDLHQETKNSIQNWKMCVKRPEYEQKGDIKNIFHEDMNA